MIDTTDAPKTVSDNKLRYWLGRLVEARYDAEVKVLEEYDKQQLQIQVPPESESLHSLISRYELDEFNKTLKKMPSKPDGYWAFSDKPESNKIVAVLKQRTDRTVVLGSFRYTLSRDGKFVNRWAHKVETA